MRISQLAERTDVPVGTIKFYLREGLLAPGRRTSRTAAEYNDAHVERIRLIRALTDTGGLGIAAVRRIVAVIDAPDPSRLDVLATAQDALLDEGAGGVERRDAEGSGTERPGAERSGTERPGTERAGTERPEAAGRARAWAAARGWRTFEEDLVLSRLERAWQACEVAGVDLDETVLDGYATAMEQVTRLDVDSVPLGAEGAVRRVVVGTVMIEPVLSALRLMAQRELSLRSAGGGAGTACQVASCDDSDSDSDSDSAASDHGTELQ